MDTTPFDAIRAAVAEAPEGPPLSGNQSPVIAESLARMTALDTFNDPNPPDGARAWFWTFSAKQDAWIPDAAPKMPASASEAVARVPVAEPAPARLGGAVVKDLLTTAEPLPPMGSGPCLVVWQSHQFTGPLGRCERCGAPRMG